jgi:hypothetical protein
MKRSCKSSVSDLPNTDFGGLCTQAKGQKKTSMKMDVRIVVNQIGNGLVSNSKVVLLFR